MRRFAIDVSTLFAITLLAGCGEPPGTPASEARELRVVTSGGFTAAYNLLAPQFEAETGIRLVTEYGASSGGAPDSIPVRLERGEQFDVVILSRPSLDDLAGRGDVDAGTRRDLVRSTIGMAVREGAPIPDIASPEAFVAVLRDAESIGYSASASGTYLAGDLLPRLGLWDELQHKSLRVVSERVAAVVARGDVEIGFQQISEILPIAGASLVGPIPDEYQKVTTFSAGVTTRAKDVAAAERLIAFLGSWEAAGTIRQTGLDPVAGDGGEFPDRPVTIVVAFGVGGSADRMTRTMSTFIAEALGQPVRVINKRGAGTLIGSNYLLEQPHDGYTMLASGFSPYLTNTILEGNADYTIDDFAYLNFQWFDEDLIAVNRDSEFRDLPSLLEAIRQHPKTVRGSVVRGSGGHLIAKLLLEVSGIPQDNLNLVAYNGGGLARAAVDLYRRFVRDKTAAGWPARRWRAMSSISSSSAPRAPRASANTCGRSRSSAANATPSGTPLHSRKPWRRPASICRSCPGRFAVSRPARKPGASIPNASIRWRTRFAQRSKTKSSSGCSTRPRSEGGGWGRRNQGD